MAKIADQHDDDGTMSWFRTVAPLVRADRSSVRYWAFITFPNNFETKYNVRWFLTSNLLPEAGAGGASDGVLELLTNLADDETFVDLITGGRAGLSGDDDFLTDVPTDDE